VIERVLETGVFVVQSRDLVRAALADFRDGPADFADSMIGRQNRAEGCRDTVTFDHRLAAESGFAGLD
jgi:predicted nucleic-acid-binding protein